MTLMTLAGQWKIPAAATAAAGVGALVFAAPRFPIPHDPASIAIETADSASAEFAAAPAMRAMAGGSSGAAKAAAPASGRHAFDAAPRKIVRSGAVTIEVADSGKARSLARAAAVRLGAELESDQSDSQGTQSQSTLTFKVAPEKLDALIDALQPIGRLMSRDLSSQNMGEEYVDLRSRLANMRRVEARLNQLLAFKTTRLADVLQVERELERVGREIETIVGRMAYIDALAASSRLSVTLCEPSQEQARTGLLWEARNALVAAANTFIATGLALLRLTCWLAAVALWAAPASLLAWALVRRLSARP